jgi:hypothetical protein
MHKRRPSLWWHTATAKVLRSLVEHVWDDIGVNSWFCEHFLVDLLRYDWPISVIQSPENYGVRK